MENQETIAVVGSGSWATALVKILQENGHPVHWWIRDESSRRHIDRLHHNPKYLSSVQFRPGLLHTSGSLQEVVEAASMVFVAVPAAFLHGALQGLTGDSWKNKRVVSAVKGMIPEENLILAEYFRLHWGVPHHRFAVVSGPCHAEEVALEKLSYLTLAAQDEALRLQLCRMMACRFIRTIPSDDIWGTEYAAVLKNIYAMAAGICHGLGYGDNFQAVLISNAIQEMARFVQAVHPIARDINDSAYLGDLLVTAYSQFSRNRTFGTMIGKGYEVRAAQLEMNMVAEGYNAARCVYEVNKQYTVDMPIAEAVYKILYRQEDAAHRMQELTLRLR